METIKPGTMPPPLTELLQKADSSLGGAESRIEGSDVLSVEALLRAAIEREMDVGRLRRMSLLLSEFERFHRTASARPQPDDAVIVIETTAFEARLTLAPGRGRGKPVTPELLRERLKEAGIVYGIRDAALAGACRCTAESEVVHRLSVAAGESGQDGDDGSVTFAVRAFDKRVLLDPDQPFFGDLASMVEDVKVGALVARITPATPGRPGRDIRGNVLNSTPGLPVSLGIGEGLQLLADGRELHALVRGSLVVGDGVLDLVPFHVVSGQLGVGQDIAFDGNVLVTGHVTGPVRIQARDIFIAGNAEAAQLSATGDVWVGGAIREKAVIDAEGRVFARTVTDAAVRAIGDVWVSESIVESRVTSSGKIVTRPGEGTIEGGEILAFRGVLAHTLGSSYGLPTKVKVGVEDLRAPLLGELDKKIRENEETLAKIDDLKGRLSVQGKPARELGPDQQIIYLSVLRKEIQSLEDLRSLRRRRQKLDSGKEEGAPPSLSITGALHPPVSVEIGEASETIKERLESCVLTLGPDRRLSIRKVDRVRPGTMMRKRG